MNIYTYPGLPLPQVNTQIAKANGTYVLTPKRILKIIVYEFKDDPQLAEVLGSRENNYNNIVLLLKSQNRTRPLPQIRFAYYYWVKTLLNPTLKSIGKTLGMRDHSSVIHGINTYRDLSQVDKHHKQIHANLSKHFLTPKS